MAITKEEVKKTLNSSENFYRKVDITARFIKQKEVKEKIFYYIVSRLKKNRVTNLNTVTVLFNQVMEQVVKGTKVGSDKYSMQMFLKNVWISSDIQKDLMVYASKPLVKPKEQEKKELTIEEKRVLQAKKMREAKARKKKEREIIAKAKEQKRLQEQKVKQTNNKETSNSNSKPEMSKEEKAKQEQIELLRNMRV